MNHEGQKTELKMARMQPERREVAGNWIIMGVRYMSICVCVCVCSHLLRSEPVVVHVDVQQRTHAAEKFPPAPRGHDPQGPQVALQTTDGHLLHLDARSHTHTHTQ